MPKSYYDPYFQEWHIKRTQATANTDEEWWIDVPRPLGSPPNGQYWAIEIHSIGFDFDNDILAPDTAAATQVIQLAITSAPRTGKTPFITGLGDPDNILWYRRNTYVPAVALAGAFYEKEDYRNKYFQRYTDDQFHGKLFIGDHLYLQLHTAACAAVVKYEICIEFTWTTISCSQLVEELQGQLNEA